VQGCDMCLWRAYSDVAGTLCVSGPITCKRRKRRDDMEQARDGRQRQFTPNV